MNDILFFPVITETEDSLGQIIQTKEFSKQVFCEKKSIPQSEFFAAGQQGIKSAVCLIVYTLDYHDEEELKYSNNDKIYTIYRKYERPDEKIELYCEVRTGG